MPVAWGGVVRCRGAALGVGKFVYALGIGANNTFRKTDSMNSLRRMLDVLSLFKPEQAVIDVETICTQLGYAPASAYRYVRELSDVGLLVRLPRGYALGPRVIELDRLMTEYHPLLSSGRTLADEIVRQTGLSVLISELYGSTVISIFQKSGEAFDHLNFGRGQPMALFRSATSRVILAYLLPRQLRKIYDAHASDPDLLRLGGDWKHFSKAMLQIRKQGFCISVGELDAEKTGLAAPIFDEKQRILGSLTLVGPTERFEAFNQGFLATLVTTAAAGITEQISAG